MIQNEEMCISENFRNIEDRFSFLRICLCIITEALNDKE